MKLLVFDDESDVQFLFQQKFRQEIKVRYPKLKVMMIKAYGYEQNFVSAKE